VSDQRNRLANGRFLQSLGNWTGAGAVYSAGDGDDHFGVAALAVGGYIEQSFAVPYSRVYSFHVAVKPIGAALAAGQATARLQDSDGNTLFTANLVGGTGDAWTETTYTWGLAPGTTYTLRLANVSAAGAIHLDDVWLWWVPLSRLALAQRVAAKLGRLATGASLSATPAGALTEGDYTYAVDSGLRAVGAIDPETDTPDVRWLDGASLDTALDEIEREMLERLTRYYSTAVDTQVGSRKESLSQIGAALRALAGSGAGGGGGRVVVRKLRHEAEDFEL
jgi:hypothetical protein